MNSSVKIFRFTETIERSMSKNCLGTVSQRTIRICQQRTVLVSQEESLNAAGMIPHATYAELPGQKHPFEQVDLLCLPSYLA